MSVGNRVFFKEKPSGKGVSRRIQESSGGKRGRYYGEILCAEQ